MSGDLDRGIDQLAALLQHPHLNQRISDGDRRERRPLHDELRRAVLARDKFPCGACHYQPTTEWSDTLMLQVDHLVPVAAGGAEVTTNLRALCERCNDAKSNRLTVDVRAVRARTIVAYCLDDVGAEDDELWRNQRVYCAFCRGLRSVDLSHASYYELSDCLWREPAFTDMYTQRRLGIRHEPQWTLYVSVEQQEQYQGLVPRRETARPSPLVRPAPARATTEAGRALTSDCLTVGHALEGPSMAPSNAG